MYKFSCHFSANSDNSDNSVEELEKHMKSMRTTYSKLLDEAPSGSEALDSFRPRERYLFEVLRFLHPHIVKRASKSNLPARKNKK